MPFEMPDAPPSSPPPGATRVEGRAAGRTEAEKKLKLPANPDFYLMHHSGGGFRLEQTERGWEVLPVLKDLVLIGGTNGVELTEAGPNSQLARAKLRDRGWTILENQEAYRLVYDVAGGVAHRLRWDVIDRYSDGTANITFDHKGFADFRRSLIEDGTIDQPRPAIIAQLRRQLERRMGRRETKLEVPSVKRAQKRDAEKLKALDSVYDTDEKREAETGKAPKGPTERATGRTAGRTQEPPREPAGGEGTGSNSAKTGGPGTPI